MSGFGVLLFLIFISALPVFLVCLWFRLARFPLSLLRCLCALLTGAAALLPALALQRIFPGAAGGLGAIRGRWFFFAETFVRVALTEELSRFLVLWIFFRISGELKSSNSPGDSGEYSGGPAAARCAALGLLAGLGFALIESAVYGAADFRVSLVRAFTAAPLHGACGARIGTALFLFRERPPSAISRFLTAVVIHGAYNFTIIMPGFSALFGVFIALSALASSVMEIRGASPGKGPFSNS